jgi:hypothetical protein
VSLEFSQVAEKICLTTDSEKSLLQRNLHTYTPTHLHSYAPTQLCTYAATQLRTYTPTHLHTYTPTHRHTRRQWSSNITINAYTVGFVRHCIVIADRLCHDQLPHRRILCRAELEKFKNLVTLKMEDVLPKHLFLLKLHGIIFEKINYFYRRENILEDNVLPTCIEIT